jgi:hypothetical protein
LISTFITKQPIAFIGQYHENVKHFLEKQYLDLLKPKVLWIDCNVIPILDLVTNLRNYPDLIGSLFFLQPKTLEIFENLINTGKLFSTKNQGFSTIIISIPDHCTIRNECNILLGELSKEMRVILFMKELFFPQSDVLLVQEEDNSE